MLSIAGCHQSEANKEFLFEEVPSSQSGIHFVNTTEDSKEINILTYLYFYNGGGVAVGDINQDGLEDVYLTSGQGKDRLYLNTGKLTFRDITEESGISHAGGWSTGVNITDINGDGWRDIYVCRLGKYPGNNNDHNLAYINNGNGTFTEKSKELGLSFSGYSTHAAFFDADLDGDLDCYLLNHNIKDGSHFVRSEIRNTKDSVAGDRLYFQEAGYFSDVTDQAGIYSSPVGYGLGISVADVNKDGWPDIYVANDFHENDYLYINQKNGTFKEYGTLSFGHTSQFSMGVDIADMDEDGLPEIFTVDMKPEEERIYKNSGGWENLQIYQFKRSYGYHHQLPKNAFQWCRQVLDGIPYYSECASLMGIEATDWSWNPLLADFNGDGLKDIFITNGIHRRPNDLDFVHFYSTDHQKNLFPDLIHKMPEGKQINYFFQNKGLMAGFEKAVWADAEEDLSNGAAYADFDHDGDLDLLINRFNQPAKLLENKVNPEFWVSLKLLNDNANTDAIGAKIIAYDNGKKRYDFIRSVAGFQSVSSRNCIIQGFKSNIDSIDIIWPEGAIQRLYPQNTGNLVIRKHQTIYNNFSGKTVPRIQVLSTGIIHHENSFNEQTMQAWIPYLLSDSGPRIQCDKDKNCYLTSGAQKKGVFFNGNTGKISTIKCPDRGISTAATDETAICYTDVNGDNREDIIIGIGGQELKDGNPLLKDILWLGMADGSFKNASGMLPDIALNTTVLAAEDIDRDGDQDIFVGVTSGSGNFGIPQPSYLLLNDRFQRFIKQDLDLRGMVTDAIWKDLDKDGSRDLIVCGHWMPVTIFYNRKGKWHKVEIPQSNGLWNCMQVEDIDDDGNPDIIAGNFGENHSLKCSPNHPLILYCNDFDGNGHTEPLLTYTQGDNRYIFPNRDMLVSQLPSFKKRFLLNKELSGKTVNDIFPENLLNEAKKSFVFTTASSVFYQKPGGEFIMSRLPSELQLAPVRTMTMTNGKVLYAAGNHRQVDPNIGVQDALPLTQVRFNKDKIEIKVLSLKEGFFSQIGALYSIGENLLAAPSNGEIKILKPEL